MEQSVFQRVKRRVIGSPEKVPRRLLVGAFVATLAIAVGGAFLALQTGLESASTSSSGYLRPLLELATNTWTYVLFLAVILRGVLLFRDRRYAEQAASITGYMERSVRRLAYEAKEPDGTTRVIATSDEDRDAIRDRILAALDGADDDTMRLNEALFEEPGPEDVLIDEGDLEPALQDEADRLTVVLDALDRHSTELASELDAAERDAVLEHLAGEDSAESRAVGEVLAEAESTFDLRDDVRDRLDELREPAQSVDVEGLALEPAAWAETDAAGTADTEEEDAVGDHGPIGVVLRAIQGLVRGPSEAEDAGSDDVDTEMESDPYRDPWLEEWKLLKLDLASAINFERILWQFAVPAVLAIVSLLVVVQFWVKPYLYPPLFAAGILVGILNYLRKSRKRSNRLEALRREEGRVEWDDVAILVKEVEVPETCLQYAWLAGTLYVHDDREEFADEVAHRAYETVNGLDSSPSVLEKQGEQIRSKRPDLHAFRDQERKLIMERLLEAVENSQDGLVPKAKLIEDVVEYDIEQRRFAPGKRGQGHDPQLVRDAYRDLVPAALVEQEIPVEEGSDETVTAVRHRADPIPPEFGAIRARFSNQFGNYASWTPLYELPDVSDQLSHEPVYADKVGYRGEPA